MKDSPPARRISSGAGNSSFARKRTSSSTRHFVGHVEIEIDGQIVLQQTSPDIVWASSDDVPLTFGFREIVIRYSSPDDAGRCGVYWSADSFALESLPHHQLFLPEPRPDLVSYERGRQLFATQRCGRCHGGPESNLSPEAPPLFHVSTGIELSWFEQKLRGHATPAEEGEVTASQARMPSFGLSDDEVEALTAWLWHMSQPTNTASVPDPQPDREDVPSGEELFHSVGCLACHQFQGLGHADPWDGGDITNIGLKRSPEWLATWLQQPTRSTRNRRCPSFK